MRIAATRVAACALLALAGAACGDDEGGDGGTGGLGGLGGLEGSTGGSEGLDDDAGPGHDLGGADDGGSPPADACPSDVPPGFAVPTDPTCVTEPEVGVFTPVIEWTKDTWTVAAGSRSSVTTPIVVQLTDDDLDGDIDVDDTPDIAYVTYETGMLRAMSGDGSKEVLSVPVPGFNRQTGISAADIDGDGIVEILGIDDGKHVIAFEHDGAIKWTSVALGGHVATHDNTPAISDMDGDGVPEIIAGRAILDAQGNLLAAGAHGVGSRGSAGALSFAVDVDDDGQQEVVVGDALYRLDGSAVWHNGQGDGFPAVADFELDGVPEIVVVSPSGVRLQSSVDGSVLWSVPVPGGQGGPPTVADYDGDGLPEVGIAGANHYSVFEGDGNVLWTNPTQDLSSGITGSAVFDFEGDGVSDVVYADETTLWVYAGHDGSVKLDLSEHSSGTRLEYPVIADVDGDGEVEIAFVNESYQSNYRGLTVVGDANHSWRPGRKIWNQHAYHITNIGDDGRVPAAAQQSWKTYNNFRSGAAAPNDGLAVPGIELHAPPPCEGQCDEGLRTVFVQLGNGGAGALSGPVAVEVLGVAGDGGEVSLATLMFAPLPAGQVASGQPVQVDPELYPVVRARAAVDEIVCHGDEVELVIDVPPCPQWPPAQG